jgi:hypothetical protein
LLILFIYKKTKDSEEKDKLVKETDLLEVATGEPSKMTTELKQKDKNKLMKKNENYSQQVKFYFNLFKKKLKFNLLVNY